MGEVDGAQEQLPEIVPVGVVVLDRDLEVVATDPVGPDRSQVLVAATEPRALDAARAVLQTGQGQRSEPFLVERPSAAGVQGHWYEVAWRMLPPGVADRQLLVGAVEQVTDRVRSRQELEWRRLESRLLQRLVRHLLEVPVSDPERVIGRSLGELGRFVAADRAYTFSVDIEAQTLTNTHEWCAPGVTPELQGLRDLPFEDIPLISGLLRTADPVVIPSVAELGEEHANDRAHLEAQGIRSIYIVPQVVEGSIVGTVGVDYVRSEVWWGDGHLSLLRSAAQAFAQAIERHRLLEERLGLLRRSVSSADDERRRLAEQLHDDVVQLLAAAVLRIDLLDVEAEAAEPVAAPLSEAMRLLRNTIAELTHPELTSGGLTSAIGEHADRILAPDGVDVTIDAHLHPGSPGEPEAFVTVFRIVQEALSNVRRHARASSVTVTLRAEDGQLTGTVVDDGVGISDASLDRPGRPGHLGLRLMRERAAVRGGQVTIARGEGGVGTVVAWSVPLKITSAL